MISPAKRNYSIAASGDEEMKIINLSKCAMESVSIPECQTQRVRGDESGRQSRSSKMSPEEKVNIENFYNELSKNLGSETMTKQFLSTTIKKQKSRKLSNDNSEDKEGLRRTSLKVPSDFNSKQSAGSYPKPTSLQKSKTEAHLDTF
mmetsp:Transcript_16887/g.25977  ORF Transcript_16887/g.25977 Transcript_16887/m.25977 type:complete len:147 (-) Transcript_16887:998-1438(-)